MMLVRAEILSENVHVIVDNCNAVDLCHHIIFEGLMYRIIKEVIVSVFFRGEFYDESVCHAMLVLSADTLDAQEGSRFCT